MERSSAFFRLASRLCLGLLLITTLTTPLFVQAQGDAPSIKDKAGIPGYPAVTISENLPERINAVYENLRWELIGAGTMAFMNAMQTFFGQLAYDAADYISSGGKGQSALYYKKGFQGYLADVAGSAAGEYIATISETSFFQTIGFDLCRPPDPKTLLSIQLSLGQFMPGGTNQAYQRPASRCDFNDIVRNYEQVYQTMSNGDIIRNVEAGLNPNANDLGVTMSIFGRAMGVVATRQTNAEKDRKEGGGFQALRDIVSGNIKTPSETIRESANQVLVKDPKANQAQINTFILQQAYELGPSRLATYTASVFLNTLASKMLTRLFSEGIDFNALFRGRSINYGMNPDDLLAPSREDTRKANISLRTPNLFQETAYDILAEMQSCPTSRGTWNCVVDEGLSQVLRSEGDSGAFTLLEAMNRGYLKGDWKLFPSTNTREERDPLCYTYGYCAGNLRKLRLMRILPIGFEFAANDPINIERCQSERGCVTLQEVVDGFTSCNSDGQKDAEHPWCKMINPNWALTALPQQCALSGYGDVMLSKGLPQRREECQDIQTCLQRDDKGQCVGGYGYCVAEKTVYRFGAQECSPRFASCRSYASRSGEQVSYVRNSLEYGRCSEDTVGCMWYSTLRSPENDRSDDWIGMPAEGLGVYFDSTMEACDASGAGCTTLLATRAGESALNLVANASFERTYVGSSTLEAWKPFRGDNQTFRLPSVSEGEAAADGANAANFAEGFVDGYRQLIEVEPGRNMVLSAFGRRIRLDGPAPKLDVVITQYPTMEAALARTGALDATVTGRDFRSIECDGRAIRPKSEVITEQRSLNWQRIECGFTTNNATRVIELSVRGEATIADAIQLENGLVATPYVDGVNGTLAVVHQKLPPEEFACTGADTDHPACASYAKMCRQTEMNCDGYKDLNSSLPEITAQVGTGDVCPMACVGYAEYRKLPSSFDLVRSDIPEQNDASHVVSDYFIPTTAQQCSQDAIGCEVFTVADGAAQGGETTVAFSSLRACELPSTDTETYFTWEGSESAGYQLRTWSLKRRTSQTGGQGEVPPEGATVGENPGPRIIVRRSADLFSQKDPLNCNEQNWRTGGDADCRQFYNSTGQVFYRYYSQTVLSTDQCRQYRLTGTSADDCTKTGGTYNAQGNSCLYLAYAPESRSCAAAFAGCRAYAGAEAGNTLNVFSANNSSTLITGTQVSQEAILVGDTSYRLDVRAQSSAAASFAATTTASGLYRISFWAKSSTPVTMVVNADPEAGGTEPVVVGTIRITGEWQRVSLGMFSGARGARTRIRLNAAAGQTAASVFLDEIVLQQLRDVVFVRKDTWNTPAQCDQTAFGIPEPQAMLGCREYQNRAGESVQVRQFSQLCRPSAVGCREFVDTRNTTSPYGQQFRMQDGTVSSLTATKADRFVYLIDAPGTRCDAGQASCKAFGKPVFSLDRSTVSSFETVYLKDDVTKYDQGLCRPSELFCEEFTTASGREYFKDPQTHVCEYREQVEVRDVADVPNGTYSGWFVKGAQTAQPCYPQALATGQTFQLLRTGDSTPGTGYQGWAGMCPVEESECTEFRDPNDLDPVTRVGRGYYFINDDRIDTKSCNNTVNPALGCVLMRNMSDASLRYSTGATQQAYQASQLNSVAPVNCQSNPTAPGCAAAQTGRCVGTRIVERRAPARGRITGIQLVSTLSSPYVGGTCSAVSDCAAETATVGSGALIQTLGGLSSVNETTTRYEGVRCERSSANDANMVVKIKVDRDCAQWLGCSSGETVYDPATNRYREVCTQMALCDKNATQGGSGAFCANYVDRSTTSTEPVLAEGVYFDSKVYSSRPLSGNAKDYSGYAIPNAFQVPDLTPRTISQDFSSIKQGLPQDRRFVAVVKMPPLDMNSLAAGGVSAIGRFRHAVPPTRINQAEIIPYSPQAYAGLPEGVPANLLPLLLCRHRGTGQIGYMIRTEAQRGREVNCYFGFQADGAAMKFGSLVNKYLAQTASQDLVLDEAYLKSMCRAYPEADAPYSSDVVTRWDTTSNPVRPVAVRAGYQSASLCAYGEDCLCSYKRVEYPGLAKAMFFDSSSQAVPPGICVGGPRNGQSCIPSSVFDISNTTSTSAKIAEAANNAQTCGAANGGGRCVAFEKVELVRGTQGTCLEYDTTRAKGKPGEEQLTCLTWNPSPIVGGKDDAFRYVDTAGYFPPQNSGQYYCASPAKTPTNSMLTKYAFRLLPAGVEKVDYNDDYVSDASELGGGNLAGSYIGGNKPEGSQAANLCEDADDQQDDDGPFNEDYSALRIVATARGSAASYTETFYGIDAVNMSTLFHGPGARLSREQMAAVLNEQKFSFIEVRPFENPNGYGRLACGYQADWVDGVSVDDYDDRDKIARGDREWRQKFFAEEDLQLYLSRGSEQMVTQPGAEASPLKMRCYDSGDGNQTDTSDCFFKTWEVGYRASNQTKFIGFTGDGRRNSFQTLATSPIFNKCQSEKPFYAIRAVFQASASAQSGDVDTIQARDVRGPWRFAGFWVTTCGGASQSDNRFIYMNIRIQNADVCRELVEVRSVKTNQDAAFTDRVWAESKYRVPMLGIEYGMTFSPFSSALNTGPAGTDPLYQTGGRLAGSSPLRPPVFLGSGFSTYYGDGSEGTPRDRYAYLSNLFARIYRVYRYNEQRISEADRTCADTASPNYGKKCVPDRAPGQTVVPESGSSADCRATAQTVACDTSSPPPVTARVCNALSGTNRGRSCTASVEMCHSYAVDPRDTSRSPRPLLGSCEIQEGWRTVGDQYQREGDQPLGREQAAIAGAFRCGAGTVAQRGAPETLQVACPLNAGWRITAGRYCRDRLNSNGQPSGGEICVDTAEAVTAGAFNCGNEPNNGSQITRVINSGTVFGQMACTRPATQTEECPIEITGTCEQRGLTLPIIVNGINVGTVGTEGKKCRMRWTENGVAFNETTDLSCQVDNDCSFNHTHFWRTSSEAYIQPTQVDGRSSWYEYGFTLSNRAKSMLARTLRTTYSGRVDMSNISSADPEAANRNNDITTNVVLTSPTDASVTELTNYPGAMNTTGIGQYTIGGCEPLATVTNGLRGVSVGTCSEGSVRQGQACLSVDSTASSTHQGWASLPQVRCEAPQAARSGQNDLCAPVSNPNGTPARRCVLPNREGELLTRSAWYQTRGTQESRQTMDNDNNSCTVEVGYRPDPKLCPNPENEFCGLLAYDMRQPTDPTARQQVQQTFDITRAIPFPTDVTLGHYTPSYLGYRGLEESAYKYLDYYTPRPPRIAAPVSSCPAGTTCGVQDLDRFNFNGITQGIINVVGGQHRSTLKFYGWAAHEQMAIRAASVDWGDGKVEQFTDVRLKNHKPFCSVQKECYSPSTGFTGLTCESDNECPLSAQACRQMGSCKDKQNIMCAQDADCRRDGSKDTCSFRTFFGNSAEACEAAPFEFSHVYACSQSAAQTLPTCSGQNFTSGSVAPIPADVRAPASGAPGTCYFGPAADSTVSEMGPRPACTVAGVAGQTECRTAYARLMGIEAVTPEAITADVWNTITCGPPADGRQAVLPTATEARCSGDTSRFCRADSDCAVGDQCIAAGIAPPGGCWDATNNTCRFTPRVFLQDNWGWCTGECRSVKSGDLLTDPANASIRHPYGGCYSPLPVGGNAETDATRLNTQAIPNRESDEGNRLLGQTGYGGPITGLECSSELPLGGLSLTSDPTNPLGNRVTGTSIQRSYRPWITFPGSLQLRPR